MSSSGYEYGRSDSGFGGYGGGLDPMGGFGAFGESATNATKSAEKKGSKERQSLIPVTIKQLINADNSDDALKVDGAELFTIKIVATIQSMEEHATNHTYQVSDSTGVIECKKWIEKDSTSRPDKQSQCRPNTLVRISGCLREYEGRRHILVYDMSPIVDWNEMTHHFLESILVHLKHTRGNIDNVNLKMETSSLTSPGMAGHNAVRQGLSMGGENDVETALVEIFRSEASSSEGLNCETAHRMLRSNPRYSHMSLMDVKKVVIGMSNQGRLYSTIDDDHYMSTE